MDNYKRSFQLLKIDHQITEVKPMSKKLVVSIIVIALVVVLAGLWVSNAAAAPEVLSQAVTSTALKFLGRPRPQLGQVTTVAESQFTIKKEDGTELTFQVDENTRFVDRQKNELTFADVKVNRWVAVAAPEGDDGTRLAKIVVILEEGFDPTKMSGAGGSVTMVDVANNAFTVKNRQGEEVTIKVNAQTIYRGEAQSLAEVATGMLAAAKVEEQSDGSLLAITVRAGYPLIKRMGEITTVNQDASTFSLKLRGGDEEVTIHVDENTRYRSKDGKVTGLKDLKTGMLAVVVVRAQPGAEGETPTFLAVGVGAVDKNELPKVDKRLIGRVDSVGENSFTITARDGQQYTFKVTGDTVFRSRGGLVQGLEDLKEGMIVGVGAKELGNGEYQAQVVLVGARRR